MAQTKEHYVSNKEFLTAIIEYKKLVKHAEENNLERPRVTNYLGECIMKIATHLAQKPNFVNYTFKEDMISDGIENCLQYIDNFDPEKSKNPFSYFTQIIWYAFIRRINKEKKLLYTKYKITEEVNLLHLASSAMSHDQNEKYNDNVDSFEWSQDYMAKFIEEFENSKRKKAKK